MVLASSTISILSMLLLLLMLFHQGLHAPTRMLNCSSIAIEIMENLPKLELTDGEDIANLQKPEIRRTNLIQFLKSSETYFHDKPGIRSNLEKLKCCLPASVNVSKKSAIGYGDEDDYKKKLRYFMSQLRNLPPVPVSGPPQPTSGSITSHLETEEC
ncbi:interleukin-3-like [Grammomys surdaster]|uniref:interleukin-3-like n=1 Tax=Grammomys surdaster TaxID=491861 RepID=UPI00109F9DFE|nr:interleukin-3-like [Grammomys surdaster]